jgi:hypothetical protein
MKRLLTLLTAMAVMVVMFAPAAPAVVHLCSDHPNQQSAQAALEQDPSLAPTLDPDGDGVACEDFFGASFFGATASPTATATATATASPTATATASPTATASFFGAMASPTATVTASPTATALAATGGSPLVAPLTLVASLALVGTGVAALAFVRRGAS